MELENKDHFKIVNFQLALMVMFLNLLNQLAMMFKHK